MPALPAPPALPRAAWRIGLAGPAAAPGAAQRAQLRAVLRHTAGALLGPLPGRAALQGKAAAEPPLLRLVLSEGCGAAEAFADLARTELEQEINEGRLALQIETVLSHPGAPLCHGIPVRAEAPPRVLVLDGDGAGDRRRELAVSRMVMRNCDLLVVLCADPEAEGGEGAAQLLRFSLRFGPDVLWLPEDAPPALLRDSADLANLHRPPPPAEPPKGVAKQNEVLRGEAALERIAQSVTAANTPPAPPHPHQHGLLERATLFLRDLSRDPPDPYSEFLRERDHQGGGLWAFYPWARSVAAREGGGLGLWLPPLVALLLLGAWAGAAAWLHLVSGAAWLSAAMMGVHLAGLLALLLAALLPGAKQGGPPATQVSAGYWPRAYHAPDRLGNAYSARYRSTTLLVIVLISLALIFAVVALVLPKDSGAKLAVGVAEAITLALIAFVVGATMWGRWQAKWVSYRLLAELCRKQEALAPYGWSLPVFDVERAAKTGLTDGAWVAWHFNALVRAAPLAPSGEGFSVEAKGEMRKASLGLITGQLSYHSDREGKGERAAHCWALWGEAAFFLTVAAVLAKLAGKGMGMAAGWETALGLAAAAVPAVSAGFFALRAYSEDKLMAEQSAAMVEELQEAQRLMEALDVTKPLTSQDLAGQTYDIAQRMLQDVTGWAQLVRVKVVEAG